MTLFKQMMIFVTVLLSLVLAMVFFVHFTASKNFVETDLYQRAKNSVNSLSLSLGDVSDDVFLMETTINAMFDGGHFQRISLKDPDDKLLYEKEEPLTVEGVPDLFISLLDLHAPPAEAVVSNGWNIVGSLQVQNHTGDAVIRMWEIFKDLSLFFAALWAVCLGGSFFMLKLLLNSLERIREQAEALEENRFITNAHIPSAPELRKVVVQMNKMVDTVRRNYTRSVETIREARLDRYRDRMTGLFNRAYFVRQMGTNLASQDAVSRGETALVAIDGLGRLKASCGYEISESFVRKTADILRASIREIDGGLATVLNEREFALILPSVSRETAMDLIGDVQSELTGLAAGVQDGGLKVACGLAAYAYDETPTDILSKLDYAATLSRNTGDGQPVHFKEKGDLLLGRQAWKQLIQKAIDGDLLHFSSQPVHSEDDDAVLHNEVFVAIGDDGGNVRRAGFFMPTAIELGMARQIDQLVIKRAAGVLEGDGDKRFSVNISPDFILDRGTFLWIRQFLSGRKHLAGRLCFEMPETAMIRHPESSLDFAGLVKGFGFGFGIDNFTMGDAAMSMLRKVNPDYIKVDYAYLYDAGDRTRSKMTLNMLQNVSESLNVKIIGTKIESPDQLTDLKTGGLRFFQGEAVAPVRGDL